VWWVEEKGSQVDTKSPRAYISNHVCGFADALYLIWRTGSCVLAEKSNFPKFMDPVVNAFSILLFDRFNPEEAKGAKERLMKAMKGREAPPFLVFPEGCCSNGTRLLSFRPGATAAMEIVQPLVIRYPNPSFDVSWTLNGPTLPWLILRMFFSLYVRMSVQWLPPRGPTPEQQADSEGRDFMEACRKDMSDRSGLTRVPWGNEDVQLACEALNACVGAEIGLVELSELKELVDLRPPPGEKNLLKNILKAFAAELKQNRVKGNERTKITFPEFKHLLLTIRERKKVGAQRRGTGGGAGAFQDAPPTSPISAALGGETLPHSSFMQNALVYRLFQVRYRLSHSTAMRREVWPPLHPLLTPPPPFPQTRTHFH